MRRFLLVATTGAILLAVALPASGAQRPDDRLDVYTAVVSDEQLAALAAQGFELTGAREVALSIQGHRGPPPETELRQLRAALEARGLQLRALHVS